MESKDVSPVDWYLVFALLQHVPDQKEDHDYYSVWENTYLVKANSPMVAFDKGVKIAKSDEENLEYKGRKGTWRYVGIKKVLPIYEKLEDGAELFWTDFGKRKKSDTENKVLTKEEFLQKLSE